VLALLRGDGSPTGPRQKAEQAKRAVPLLVRCAHAHSLPGAPARAAPAWHRPHRLGTYRPGQHAAGGAGLAPAAPGMAPDSGVAQTSRRRADMCCRPAAGDQDATYATGGGGGAAPVMMATASDIVCERGVITVTRRPSRWMWMRSAISKTCGML